MQDVLLITGSMGVGKTATLGEASDLLAERGIAHAAVDLDALGLAYGVNSALGEIAIRNLVCVCANYESAGITKLLAAGAVESSEELEQIRRATNAQRTVVCRLRAPLAVMQRRVALRERGIFSEQYVARVGPLEARLDAVTLEDFSVETAEGSVTDAAQRMLTLAGWMTR